MVAGVNPKNLVLAILLLLIPGSVAFAAPGGSSDSGKRIVGKWLADNGHHSYYITFKANGTFASQKDDTGPLSFQGNHWHVEGDKLVKTFLQVNDSAKIVSFKPSEFVTDNGELKTTYVRQGK